MKLKNIFSILAVIIFLTNATYAQVSVSSFIVQNQYLQGGKILIKHAAATTEIKIEVNFNSYSDNQGYANSGFSIKTRLATGNPSTGQIIHLSSQETTSSTEFLRYNMFLTKIFTVSIDKSKLVNGLIMLLVEPSGSGEGSFTGKYYNYVLETPPNPDLAKIQSMGFSTIGIKDFSSTHYLVEEDVLINKSSLSNTSPYSNVVSSINDHNINILIDQSIWGSQTWYSGVNAAIEAWNSIPNNNIKLHVISDNYQYPSPRVDITITGDGGVLASTLSAVAEFPKGDGGSGGFILVNSDYRDPSTGNFINSGQTASAIIHEIGHSLGLKNNNDIYDSATLYPLNNSSVIAPYISGRDVIQRFGQDNFNLSYISSESGISYLWKIIGINGTTYNYEQEESIPGIPEFSFSLAGNYQIQCTVSGGKYSTPVTVTKNIVVQ